MYCVDVCFKIDCVDLSILKREPPVRHPPHQEKRQTAKVETVDASVGPEQARQGLGPRIEDGVAWREGRN